MTPAAAVVNRITKLMVEQADLRPAVAILDTVKGWSNLTHFLLFRSVVEVLPAARICVCGVYQGLDLALLVAGARQLPKENFPKRIVGVDLFSDQPCKDWPAELRSKTWEEAQHFPPPSMELAAKFCPSAELVKANSIDYLRAHAGEFDAFYLDTSHDEETVTAEITTIKEANPRAILVAGDDYRTIGGEHHWGVDKACDKLLPNHIALFDRLWISNL